MKNFDSLQHCVETGLVELRGYLEDLFCRAQSPPVGPDVVRQLFATGGKRFRARLVLGLAYIHDVETKEAVCRAGIVEMLHAASMLHDDVVDGAKMRHGVPTPSEDFGNRAAILAGDWLLAIALREIAAVDTEILPKVASACEKLVSGELLEWNYEHRDYPISFPDYEQVVDAKTGALFLLSGQLIRGAEGVLPTLGVLGRLFQMVDDFRDFFSEGEEGKGVGNDFMEKKWTYPVLLLWPHLSPERRRVWVRLRENGAWKEALSVAVHCDLRALCLEDLKKRRAQFLHRLSEDACPLEGAFFAQLVETYLMV